MYYWVSFFILVVFVTGKPSIDHDECGPQCVGSEYECIDGQCYCADGFIPNYFLTSCVRCPDLGEKCSGTCCSRYSNTSLQCWHGICQSCYDTHINWSCRDTVDHIILISTTQVIMGTALVLGIVATMILLYKLCVATNIRAFGSESNNDTRLSIGSLQMYVEQRLQDAPPRYSRTIRTSAVDTVQPPTVFHNEGFIHDRSVPPPPYTEELKNESNQNTTVHI